MSGALEAKELLSGLSATKEPLSELVSGIYHAGRESRTWVDSSEYGVPFMGSTDILSADLSNLPLISKKQIEANPNFKIGAGWTLITRSGTIGRMAFARSDMNGLACSEHVMRVVPDENKVKPGFIYAYLSSMFGVPLIISGTYGSIIQSIEPHHISSLPVPRLGEIEDRAHALVQKAADLRVEAAEEVKAATTRFLVAAGLEDITSYDWLQNSGRIGFVASISKTILRAVNYIPINQQLSEIVKTDSPEWKTLIELVEPGTLRRGPRFKRIDSDPEFGVELIGQREMSNLVPSGRWVSKSFLPKDKLIFASEGTIMVNAQGGINETDSFARSQFISGKKRSYIFSEHFLRVIANENLIPRGALFAYLRSNIAFRLLRSCAVGSMQQDFHPALLAELPIPIIDDSEAQSVDEMIRLAYQKYDEAIDAEDEARDIVEQAIKEGGR
jgi:type I restriction enzyme S subunit